MNNVAIVGRLTKDIDLKYAGSNNMAIGRFSVAVDRKLSKEKKQEAEANNQPTVDFINCIAFSKTAEIIGQYFHKGNRIAITGHIQTGSYENQQGQRIYTTDVIVDSFDFIETNSSSNNTNTNQGYGNTADFGMGATFNNDDELPF